MHEQIAGAINENVAQTLNADKEHLTNAAQKLTTYALESYVGELRVKAMLLSFALMDYANELYPEE